jgi:hypothetical protein
MRLDHFPKTALRFLPIKKRKTGPCVKGLGAGLRARQTQAPVRAIICDCR